MFIRYLNEKDPHNDSPYNITVNIAERKLSLFKEGKLVKTYPIAVGKPSTPTPKGNFKIINKYNNPGGPFDSIWLGLSAPNGDYGIHGTTNPSSIGKAVYDGCIRTLAHKKNNKSICKATSARAPHSLL